MIFFSACRQTQEDSIVRISGSVNDDGIEKMYVFAYESFLSERLIDSVAIDSNQFSFSLRNIEPGYFIIQSAPSPKPRPKEATRVFLESSDTLEIKFSEKEITYSGASARLQEYQKKAQAILNQDSLYKNVYRPYYKLAQVDSMDIVPLIETIRQKQIDFFIAYFKGSYVPELFRELTLSGIEQQVAQKYFSYLKYHHYYTQDSWDYFKVDSSYYTFLDRIDLNTKNNLLKSGHIYFLEDLTDDLFIRENNLYESEKRTEYQKTADQSKLNYKANWIKNNLSDENHDLGFYGLFKSYTFSNALVDSLEMFYSDARNIFEYVEKNYVQTDLFEASKDIYHAYLNIEPGTPAPHLALPDSSGQLIALEDFRGKVVYIDFWGTWCGPCIEAIPKHRKLQETFSGKDVVFFNVALEYSEKEIESWKKFLEEKDFPGTHVVAEKQFNNEAIQAYKVSWAPTYVLIDKEGKIVLPKAPTPDRIEEKIIALLE